MGKLYAQTFSKAGYRVCGTDMPDRLHQIKLELAAQNIEILADGHGVSRQSDIIIYCVEAERIDEVVKQFALSTKYGAIVGGQTSVKTPEIQAFEKYLPKDAQIVTIHSLHGPAFPTEGQTLVVLRHRATNEAYAKALSIYQSLGSNIIELNDYEEHDKIMADTQAVTHMGFESMGSAWKNAGFYPWEDGAYTGGIDNVKILTTLRIFSYKSHIYAGLAILNPYARQQVRMYAQAESELFKLMICEKEEEFREALYAARSYVFHHEHQSLLLDNNIMREFSLADQGHHAKPNSHLSILTMVYAWYKMKVNPYDNLICQTPPFKLRLGIAEYLFKNDQMLEESIQAALYDKSIRGDDLAFHTAVHEWASIIGYGDLNGYKEHFESAKAFFKDRLDEGRRLSAEMIIRLTQKAP